MAAPERITPEPASTCVRLAGVELSDVQLLGVALAMALLVIAASAVSAPLALAVALACFGAGARATLRASRGG